ncbi:MAG: tRNA 2-thiouridine(34) synthase MnmA, partial [Candidatus Aegiribacteria sp.]|nr:tRNA 2-thiouridine(34) synthase MnmA [Candidatus Aegiribacteria sp.]MBD3294482.1 tRNA 2-thiouridine(34) synthase MnmA [Candidatus Fermentibacteria bacterium]
LGALGRKMYVVSIDPGSGTVVAGQRKDLLSSGCRISQTNWLKDDLDLPGEFLVQTRYRRPPVRAVVDYDEDCFHIEYSEPEEAVAPGQVCAVYKDDILVGGGIITSTERLL